MFFIQVRFFFGGGSSLEQNEVLIIGFATSFEMYDVDDIFEIS